METYGRFLFEFLHQFFSGFGEMLNGIWKGIVNLFNFKLTIIQGNLKNFHILIQNN